MPASTRRRWTRAEVLELIEKSPLQTPRYELVDGELFVTPSPNDSHQIAIGWLQHLLWDYVLDEGVGQVLMSPSDTQLEPETIVQPDLYVAAPSEVERPSFEPHTYRNLRLAVEVLSPSSKRGDRGRKRALYQRTVPEYWIVDTQERTIERWLPDSSDPQVIRETLEWHPAGATSPWRLDVQLYFARIYRERR